MHNKRVSDLDHQWVGTKVRSVF